MKRKTPGAMGSLQEPKCITINDIESEQCLYQ